MKGSRGFLHRLDRSLPVTVKVGTLIVLISVAASVGLGYVRAEQTRARIDESYALESRSIIQLLNEQVRRHPKDAAAADELLERIVDTRPLMLRIRAFREGTKGAPEVWASSFSTDHPVDLTADLLLPDREPIDRVVGLGGQRVLLHVEPVELEGGVVSIGTYFSAQPRDEALATVRRNTVISTIVAVGLELVALIAAMYFLVLRRVKSLGHAAAEVSAGDLTVRLPEGGEEEGRDELANAARQFSHMVEALETREQEQAVEAGQRRQLLARLLRAEEEERARIANDLHDDTIQKLTVVGLNLHRVKRSAETEEQRRALEEVEESVRLALYRARHLMFELAPPSLENEGLDMALKRYLAQAAEDGGFTFELTDELLAEPGPETRNLVYRVAQEAMVNIRKHATATQVELSLAAIDGGVRVRISDDGVGFDAEAFEPEPGHLGMEAMKERTAMAGGWCRIEASPGVGTTVEFWIPDQDEPAGDTLNG